MSNPNSEATENLSCLMDGELDAGGQRFLLRRLASDSSMAQTWRRYHLVRACLHKELNAPLCIADRVSEAIGQEETPKAARAPGWLRPVAGGAIAASAALFAIVAINSSLLQRTQDDLNQPGFIAQPNSLDQPFSRQPIPVSFEEMSPAQRQRANTYMLRHNQAAGDSGFVSYIPIVTGVQGERIDVEAAVADQNESAPANPEQASPSQER